MRNNLTQSDVTGLGEGMHADGGGLYLRVQGDSRTWAYRYSRRGRAHTLGMGSTDTWTLAEARKRARGFRQRLDEGADLVAEVRAEKTKAAGQTFRQAMEAYLEAHRDSWRNPKHRQQWENTLATYCPKLMPLSVADITTEDVEKVLKPIWRTKTETASRLRGRIEAVLDSATVRGWRPANAPNPARWTGHLELLFPAKNEIAPVKHQPAVAWKALPAVLRALLAQSGTSGQATAFIGLTAVRSAEARLATWSEVDMDESTWTIPADRMKANKEHVVPLSGAAMAILRTMAARHGTDRTAYVFPGGRRGAALSDVAVSKSLHSAAGTKEVTVHGLRSTFRDWCGEHRVEPHLAEMCLAHTNKNKVEASYARSTLITLRREIMQRWADYLAGE